MANNARRVAAVPSESPEGSKRGGQFARKEIPGVVLGIGATEIRKEEPPITAGSGGRPVSDQSRKVWDAIRLAPEVWHFIGNTGSPNAPKFLKGKGVKFKREMKRAENGATYFANWAMVPWDSLSEEEAQEAKEHLAREESGQS